MKCPWEGPVSADPFDSYAVIQTGFVIEGPPYKEIYLPSLTEDEAEWLRDAINEKIARDQEER